MKFDVSRIAITGGLGYVGRNVVVSIAELNPLCHLLIIDDFSNAPPTALEDLRALGVSFEFNKIDIYDGASLLSCLKEFQPDAIIHLAALKKVDEGERRPHRYFEVNCRGTLNVLEAIRQLDCRELVFSSTAAVYGDAKPPIGGFCEATPLKPKSIYGWTKVVGEKLIEKFVDEHSDIRATVLRYFNPLGSGPGACLGDYVSQDSGSIHAALLDAWSTGCFRVNGSDYPTSDGTPERDFIHISDLVAAHLCFLQSNWSETQTGFEVFNVGYGKPISVASLVLQCAKDWRFEVRLEYGARRTGDVFSSYANCQKLIKTTKWIPRYGVKEICESLLKYDQAFKNGVNENDNGNS